MTRGSLSGCYQSSPLLIARYGVAVACERVDGHFGLTIILGRPENRPKKWTAIIIIWTIFTIFVIFDILACRNFGISTIWHVDISNVNIFKHSRFRYQDRQEANHWYLSNLPPVWGTNSHAGQSFRPIFKSLVWMLSFIKNSQMILSNWTKIS